MNSKKQIEIHLHLGPELKEYDENALQKNRKTPKKALNLKRILKEGKPESPSVKPVLVKKSNTKLVLLAYLSRSRQGLSRFQWIATALVFVLFLNLTQGFYKGRSRAENSLVLAAEALSQLKTGGFSLLGGPHQDEALQSFQEAEKLLAKAKEEGDFLLQEASPWVTEPSQVESYRALLELGDQLGVLGTHLLAIQEALANPPEKGSLTEWMAALSKNHIQVANETLKDMNNLLVKVDLSGTAYEEAFDKYRKTLQRILPWGEAWQELEAPILYALGDTQVQHYALLFQNPNEMRLGGGFVGSFAIVELNDGRLSSLTFHDIYDFANQNVNPGPQPNPEMRELNSKLELQDANFSPDFELSAQSFMRLLEDAGGPGLDGVIGLSFDTVKSLLALEGDEIRVPGSTKKIALEDLNEYLGVEIKQDQAEGLMPKQIVFDFAKEKIASLREPKNKLIYTLKFVQALSSKQTLIYHKNKEVLQALRDLEWTGRLPVLSELDADYFMPVMTTLGGTKIESWMQSYWDYQVLLLKDGSRKHRITLDRKNTWTERDWLNLKQNLELVTGRPLTKDQAWIFGEGPLESAWRFYIPEDAKWLHFEGLYKDDMQLYYDENLKHSYYLWTEKLAKGESGRYVFEFIVPEKLEKDSFEFYFFKQAGRAQNTASFRLFSESRPLVHSNIDIKMGEPKMFWEPDSNEGDFHFQSIWEPIFWPF